MGEIADLRGQLHPGTPNLDRVTAGWATCAENESECLLTTGYFELRSSKDP